MIGVLFVLNAVVLLVLLCRVRRARAVCSALLLCLCRPSAVGGSP